MKDPSQTQVSDSSARDLSTKSVALVNLLSLADNLSLFGLLGAPSDAWVQTGC